MLMGKTAVTMLENIDLVIDVPAIYNKPTLPNTSQQVLFVKIKKIMRIVTESSLLRLACENCMLFCMYVRLSLWPHAIQDL